MKKSLLIILLITITLKGFSQDVSLTASAPESVAAGEKFQLKFTLSNAKSTSFTPPALDDFQVLGTSQFQSSGGTTIIINGQVVQQGNSSVTWVYTLSALSEGTFTIGAAKAIASGTTYSSSPLTIKVAEGSTSSTYVNSNTDNLTTASGDVFFEVDLDKTEVYVGEQIIASARFYSKYDIVDFGNAEFPAFDGFWTNDIYSPTNISFDVKVINKTKYLTTLWQQKVLIPQKSGTLTIDKYSVDCILGYWGFSNGQKTAYSSEKTITVKPLPVAGKPTDFSGAVGDFKIAASIDKETVNIDEPVTITLTITGSGNFELFDLPEFTLPNSFEQFDPEESVNTSATTSGITGTRTVDYIFIPRAPGKFTVPATNFTYFNPVNETYNELYTPAFDINVDGVIDSTSSNYVAIKSSVDDLGTDIQYIQTKSIKLKKADETFFGSTEFYFSYLIALVLFLIFVILKRRQIKIYSDISYVKNKQANKVSLKRLKLAAQHLSNGNKDLFYEEVLKALWGYISDKLLIPVSELSRDNVVETFGKFNLDNDTTQEFIKVLDDCEIARYAPAFEQNTQMQSVYDEASKIIGKIEQSLKR